MVYYFGLAVVCLTILVSIDDLIWDLVYAFAKVFRLLKESKKITTKDMESVPPKMMALIIAAYHEEDVIEAVLRNLIRSTNYPYEMYHIFVGVYPNDPATSGIIEALSKEFKHVHPVVHYLNGPSSKADNINNVLDYTKKFEKEHKLEFKFYVIHDSEDIVHPFEFHLENYLLEKHYAVQIPVFPLLEKPTFKNMFQNMVTGTYADEFAENHYQTMRIRNTVNAFVPSAGTGFAIKREVIESFDGDVFPVGSLTEDYKLSLEFKRRGYHLYYPLEKITRVNFQGNEVDEYIATRSMFPKTYSAAVRQKARWIHGITMQSFKLNDQIWNKEMNLQTRYSFYKDWKAKFGNLLVLPSYLVFTYFILYYFFDLPVMYPTYSLSWYLMVMLTIVMIHRQLSRFRAVKHIYGYRSAFISTFLPPIIPIRLVLGNVINFHATLRAWKNHLFTKEKKESKRRKKKPKKVTWSKTDHEFLTVKVLDRFRMKVGDRLLSMDLISPADLKECLEIAEAEGTTLRAVILRNKLIEEDVLLEAISLIIHKPYYPGSLGNYIKEENFLGFDVELLKKLHAAPLYEYDNTLVIMASVDFDLLTFKNAFKGYELDFICTSNEQIQKYFDGEEESLVIQSVIHNLKACIVSGYLSPSQALLALKYSNDGANIKDILNEMGLMACEEIGVMDFFSTEHLA